jgi:hypothetical protein
VFKMRDEEWRGRIEAGAEGLVKAEWAPDGRTILCFSEWGVSTSFIIAVQSESLTPSIAVLSSELQSGPWSPERRLTYSILFIPIEVGFCKPE